jgi:S1-C subfamily serine protease
MGVVLLGIAIPGLALADDPGFLGVELEEESEVSSGARILDVKDGSPADQAGLQAGFRVRKCNGKRIQNSMQLIEILKTSSAGDVLKLFVENPDGWGREFEVTLAPHPEARKVVKKAYLGITLGASDRGVLVSEVVPGSPAEKAGLKAGDLILAAGDRKLDGGEALLQVLADRKPGSQMKIQVERDGWRKGLEVTLGAREEEISRPAGKVKEVEKPVEPDKTRKPWIGVQLDEARDRGGLLIVNVIGEGPAAKAGLKNNDILVKIGGMKVGSFADLEVALEKYAAGDEVDLVIRRKDKRKEMKLVLGGRD